MDTNWCFFCGNHIEHSDSALYCSEKCKTNDTVKDACNASLYQFDYVARNKPSSLSSRSSSISRSNSNSASRTSTGFSIPSSPSGSLSSSPTTTATYHKYYDTGAGALSSNKERIGMFSHFNGNNYYSYTSDITADSQGSLMNSSQAIRQLRTSL